MRFDPHPIDLFIPDYRIQKKMEKENQPSLKIKNNTKNATFPTYAANYIENQRKDELEVIVDKIIVFSKEELQINLSNWIFESRK